ncbi:MAG: crossover junction endodeoxyribonuclease RuvC [candidate division Zixibacteria bacterium]|nr:crossover junction endodeoxyribonuclease RuvC [candidate division Zixibacteria bacterium]
MRKNKIKILAIDPGTKHMGFAAFEGTELVDYGVKTIRQGSEVIILDHIEEIISRLIKEKKPDYFVLERNSFSQIKQNFRLTMAISKMKHIAKKFGVLVYEYDPRTIRKEICNDGNASKIRVAQTIVISFDELKVYLQSDKVWVLRYNLNLLDAVAIGMTFIRKNISSTRSLRNWLLAR